MTAIDETSQERHRSPGVLIKKSQSRLKKFSNSSFLAHPCDSKPFILETDASDFAISGVLKLLAIVDSFNTGDTFCKVVSTSHGTLRPQKSGILYVHEEATRRQARWSLELSEYDFSITHRLELNGRADALSRQSDHHLENDCSNFKRILDPKQIIDLQSLISDMDLHVIVHSEKMASPQQLMFTMTSDQRLFGITTNLGTLKSSLAPLDDIEQMEENSEFIARNLEEVGQARSAANVRTKAQAEAMRKRSGFDENTPDYFFKVGDMVKMKHHDRLKLEFKWKGPYHVVDVGPCLKTRNLSDNLREPEAALPNKFDGSRKNFRGFINQLELVFQLQDQRYDTDRKKIATLGTLLTDKALSWYNPYIEQPERYAYDLSSWSAFKARMKATFV
ncbi:hypothetical protein BASA83_007660 [Batrachochytrium salamandrivorans]|nr:hypothetical protein BASA83_007660 [Batrachochytrium salamandrivorans]